MTVLPTIPKLYVNKLNEIINNFLWNGKKAKISLSMLQKNKDDGGAGLVDFTQKISRSKLVGCRQSKQTRLWLALHVEN